MLSNPEMLRLKALGWGVRRIAGELGCSHMTVRWYLAAGGWVAYRGRGRRRTLSGIEEWVAERFRRHAGNADLVRQELRHGQAPGLSVRLRPGRCRGGPDALGAPPQCRSQRHGRDVRTRLRATAIGGVTTVGARGSQR
jgi:hypothetical protein